MRIFSRERFADVRVFYLLLNNVFKMANILESVKSFDYGDPLPFSEIFCTKVGNEKNCLIVCVEHLRIILISKRKSEYACDSKI